MSSATATKTAAIDRPKLKKSSNFKDVMHRLSKNKAAMLGLIIFLLEIVIAVAAPLISPYDITEMDFTSMHAAPSSAHLMGTDELGRDILSRLLYGGRYSLGLGVASVAFAVLGGVILGAIAGYFGGVIDNLIMRFLDIFQSIPMTLLCIAISAALGSGFFNTILALAISSVPGYARLLRGSILNIRKMEYLEAADAINSSKFRTIVSHVLPNSFSPLIVNATMGMATAIMMASGLSFIGLGVQAPTPEWGAMLSGARNFLRDHPHEVIFPGIAIAVTVLALNMMGDGLRDAMDPKLKD
jgi:peptide/nickel transport system permease protein